MTHWHTALRTQIELLTGQAAAHGPHYHLAATRLSEVATAARTRRHALDHLDRLILATDDDATATLLRGCRARLAGDHYAAARAANDTANATWFRRKASC